MAIIDGLLGAKDLVRWARARSEDEEARLAGAGRLEARLAGVVVSALREAFDRDHRRFEIERERLEEERQRIEAERARAERALRLELLRQAGERELGRLRLLTGVTVVSWLGTIVVAVRSAAAGGFARAMLGVGVLLLIGALAAVFSAQSQLGRVLAQADSRTHTDELSASAPGVVAPWLIVCGLAAVAFAAIL